MKLTRHIARFNTCKKSFGFKIFISLISVIFIVLSVFSLIHIYQESKSIKEHLISKGTMVAGFLAGRSQAAVFAENKEALENIVKSVINEKEVSSASIYSRNWEVLATIQKKTEKGNSEGYFKKISEELPNSNNVRIIEQPEIIELFTPVSIEEFPKSVESLYFEARDNYPKEKIIGYVRIGLDKTILTDKIKSVFYRVLALALILSLSATVIIYVAARRVSFPIIRLTESVRMLGIEGNTEKIMIETDDEIGKLAAAFNKMSEDLRKREDEKKALEDALVQSKKMEALGTLSRGIAHDFNNILSTVQGASFILRKKLDKNSPLHEYVKKIQTSLARADNLIQSLLAFSRGQEIYPQPVDINALARKIEPFCADCTDMPVQCAFSFSDEELTVLCDQVQIEQVLLNLVANAHQAMPGGGILSVSTRSVVIGPDDKRSACPLVPGPYALISVSDTGTGIRDEIKERIFEPFFTTKETGKGTGLGLSITYGIVKRYKGHIDVSTRLGEGTTFDVFLPMFGVEKDNAHVLETDRNPMDL